MDPTQSRFCQAYTRNPKLFMAFFVAAATVGIVIGYRFFGPAIFG